MTLEVLDCRQQRQQRSSSGAEQGGGASLGGLGSAAGDRAGEAGGGRGGRGKLIRMLTPKGLGQSLRDIADNTLTTLKRGVSAKEGREDDGSVDGEKTGKGMLMCVYVCVTDYFFCFQEHGADAPLSSFRLTLRA